MGRAPTYTLLLLRQVTLRDVYARVADLGLDVDAFIPQVLSEPSDDRDADFVEAITWSGLKDTEVSKTWKRLGAMVHLAPTMLAHPNNPEWAELAPKTARKEGVHLLQPVGVRTLRTRLEKTGWDYRRMPDDTNGTEGTLEELIKALHDHLIGTIGGEEYLHSDDETPARVLAVLATTLAAVLLDAAATITDARLRARVLRVDIYERAVEGAGLGKYFQVIRRIVEIDHPKHLRVATNGPGSAERDFGFIEYRGRGNQYLAVNTSAAKKWLDPKSLP